MTIERCSTDQFAPAQQVRGWCRFGSSTLSRLDVRPKGSGAFKARMVRARLGEVGITNMVSSAAVAVSADGDVGAWAGSREGALAITCYRAGHPRLTQGGRSLRLAPGDVVIRDLRRRWQQESDEDFALMTVKVPVDCLRGGLEDLATRVMVPLRSFDPRAQLLSSLVENLGRLAFERACVPRRDPVERLLRAAMEVAFDDDALDVPLAALPTAITDCIDAHLGDPDLSVASLAQRLRLSTRSLQRLFQQAGTSPKACILSRRLEAAALRLRVVSALDRVSITQLALSVGFNDPGYFTRAFHAAYGMTPTDYRKHHRLPV